MRTPASVELAFKHRLRPTRHPRLNLSVTLVNTPPHFRDVVIYLYFIHILQSKNNYSAMSI